MDMRWFKGIPQKDKEARTMEVLNYRNAFDDLREILEKEEVSFAPDYNLSSWSHKQADNNGANRMLRSILKLIEVKKE